MRSMSDANYEAINSKRALPAAFLWLVVKHRETGFPIYDGYWSGTGDITVPVVDPATGGTTIRTYAGRGDYVSISDIPFSTGLSVKPVTIKLGVNSGRANDIIRAYECKQGRVEIHRGYFDPATQELVAPAMPRFVGFIDSAPITTGEEGGDAGLTLTVNSHTQELSRSNTDTRSDASQRLRSATDNFFADVSTVSEWDLSWGAE